ncbi:hypothetical protein ACT7C8_17260 [Bacillus cereus]
MQVTRLLKPSTINRRINSIKRYFDWAKQKDWYKQIIQNQLSLYQQKKRVPNACQIKKKPL